MTPTLLRTLTAALVLLGAAAPEAAAQDDAPPARPNIIVVFIDDMGWSDLSCFGGRRVETEHIDRLAAEGIRFESFYVNSPICSPSRVALTTGQYPQRWGVTSFLNNRKENQRRGVAQWLDPEAPVLARELQAAGYATGHFGKWHMGGQRDVADAPPISDYGFDRSLTNFEGMGAKLLPLTMKPGDPGPELGRIWERAEILGEPVTWMQRSEITGGFVDAAVEFIGEAVGAGRPFYVNVWPDDVHSPFFPPLEKWGDGGKRDLYDGVLDAMDEQLARLFAFVRDDGRLRANTLILLCSDNGHEAGAGSSDPLRGAKTWLYEGGVRSPLIAWGPGLIEGGATGTANETAVFSALDLNRALYAIAGIQPPDGLDGEDVSAALLGHSESGRGAPLFWRRPPDRPGFGHGLDEDNPDLAARDGRWKYLVNLDGSDPQLYDVVTDPAESVDRAARFPEVAARLDEAVREWNAAMPADASDPAFAVPGTGSLPPEQFVNPIGEGADPWVVRDQAGGRYLWCFSEGNRGIAIHTSDRLTSIGKKHVVWRAPDEGPFSREVWAPELHFLDGRWVVYFAASDGDNANHLAYALVSESDDPLGEYDLHGPFATGDGEDGASPNVWAIDMTVLEHGGKRYAIWSGWDAPGTDRQFLYIAPMASPTELAGPRVLLCPNDDYPWEFTEDNRQGRGLHEAPQVLGHAGRIFVTYSCGASWLPTYKLGMLELIGDDPLNPEAWMKYPRPVFQSTRDTFGVGHSCFVPSPDGREWWHVFHAKRDRDPGWRRAVFVQPFGFRDNGLPDFGEPVRAGEPLPRPGGEPVATLEPELPYKSAALTDGFSYYGHQQFYAESGEGLTLGSIPGEPVNGYRSGEKAVLDATAPDDFTARVTVAFGGEPGEDEKGAGLLFRTTAASVGYDAHRGYFAGIKPSENVVLAGVMDGERWRELARAPYDPARAEAHRLSVSGRGPVFAVRVDGEPLLSFRNAEYRTGAVGVRAVDTAATFRDLEITGAPPPYLYADPNYHGSCDPEVVWNPVEEEWWVYYTARRATLGSGTYVGTPIGVAASDDGTTWRFIGYCSFDGTKGEPDNPTTHWAPEIVRDGDTFHLFATYKDNADPPWGGKGAIRHYSAPAGDLLDGWRLAGTPNPDFAGNADPTDASVLKVGDRFHAYYQAGDNDGIQWSSSGDLADWDHHGPCAGDVNAPARDRGFGYQEAPHVFEFGGAFWMLTDPHRGLAVYRSDDAAAWSLQPGRLLEQPGLRPEDATFGRHPSVAVAGDRAIMFYHTEPNRPYPTPPPAARTPEQKKSFLQAVELETIGGRLVCNRDRRVAAMPAGE